MGFKPKSAQLEDDLDKLGTPEPPPLSKVQKTRLTPEYKEEMENLGMKVKVKGTKMELEHQPKSGDLEVVITQLQNIWEKLSALSLMVAAQYPPKKQAKAAPVIDDTHPPAYPITQNGGHPVVNGKPAPFIEVPTVEQLLARATAWVEANGKPALVALVKEFGVKKIGEMNDEQRAAFMERLG